jgi:uncharacterized protein
MTRREYRMLSCDTNILFYAYNASSPLHNKAMDFLTANAENRNFAICELVLIEFYVLLRNPAVIKTPLHPRKAVEICRAYRKNRAWRVLDYPGSIMNKVWERAAEPKFPRRSIFDARLALPSSFMG